MENELRCHLKNLLIDENIKVLLEPNEVLLFVIRLTIYIMYIAKSTTIILQYCMDCQMFTLSQQKYAFPRFGLAQI